MEMNRVLAQWFCQGKTEVLGEKFVPLPLCPPQISHGLAHDRTGSSAGRHQRLASWAMETGVIFIYVYIHIYVYMIYVYIHIHISSQFLLCIRYISPFLIFAAKAPKIDVKRASSVSPPEEYHPTYVWSRPLKYAWFKTAVLTYLLTILSIWPLRYWVNVNVENSFFTAQHLLRKWSGNAFSSWRQGKVVSCCLNRITYRKDQSQMFERINQSVLQTIRGKWIKTPGGIPIKQLLL